MGKVKYGDFDFPKDFGFTGSSSGRADAKAHRDAGPDEYGDRLASSGPKVRSMAKGGPVKKQIGGVLSNPVARAAAAGALGAQRPMAPAAPALTPAMRPAMAPAVGQLPVRPPLNPVGPAGMAAGGKFIQKAVKHPGRMKRYAKKLGVGLGEAITKAKHSSDPSLRAAGNLGARFRSGEFKK